MFFPPVKKDNFVFMSIDFYREGGEGGKMTPSYTLADVITHISLLNVTSILAICFKF